MCYAWDEELDDRCVSPDYSNEFIEHVIMESMRKYTIASNCVLRYVAASEGFQLGTHLIPQGHWVFISLYALHNSERNWGSDAHLFRPSRFTSRQCAYSAGCLNTHDSTEASSLLFAPFSYGARSCLGMNLALLVIRMTAVELLSKFTFAFAPGDMGMEDERYAMEMRGWLYPRDGLPVLVNKRTSPRDEPANQQ